MPESTQEQHERIIRLLKRDKRQKEYNKAYMKEYRKTHKPKVYYTKEQIRLLMRQSRYRTDVIKFIRFLYD
jgi:hypothetical protein